MMKSLCVRILAALCGVVVSANVARALPEVAIGTGYAVTPADAWIYYQAQGLTSPTWTEEPEFDKLAAALGNDPDRIYEYVRNEIDVIPLFGAHAGARGAYIDKAGTAFDQAQLMVELLRSVGITASYKLGRITLTGTQFNDWYGLTNPTAARKLLADGGTPATVTDNGVSVTSVTMMHVWVLASIGGTTYAFDPSVPRPPPARIDEVRVAPMRLADGAAEAVWIFGYGDEVDVVGHQAVSPNRHPRTGGLLGEQVAIDLLIASLEEDRFAPVAALGHVMGDAGNDDAGETGHGAGSVVRKNK